MALLERDPTGAEYAQTEQELQDRIISIYGTKETDEHLFRPDLADHHKVGFFGLDRPSQTEVTEIVDLKEMTEVLQILLQDVATLKRDINFTKHIMQADYESKLQKKSLELYCRINERVTELEKMHEERVGTVRRAFRTQLSDAIARVAVLYNNNLQKKVRQAKSKHEGDAASLEEKYKELQATVQRNESIIHMLKMQIEHLQQNKEPSASPSLADSERRSDITPQTPVDEQLSPDVPSVNQEAEELQEELAQVNRKLDELNESLQDKEEVNNQLSKEINKLEEQLLSERMEKEQLHLEIESIKSAMEHDKASTQKLSAGMQKQKDEMEKMMMEKLKQAQVASNQAAEAEARSKQQSDKEKMAYLYEQEKKLKEELSREKAKFAEALKEDSDINKLRKNEQMLKDEVLRLKREIEKVHKTWEKKFAILQQSLHALKDESYIRHTLQRQAANLHHAAVSYSVDSPMGILPTKHKSPPKKPLPEIPKYAVGALQEKDFISYTVSAPSGRGTALFSTDENQIMSENDKEDIPEDIVPLPDRPARNSNTSLQRIKDEMSRFKSTQVIIVPHVPVN